MYYFLISHRGNGHEDLYEQPGDGVLDVFVLDLHEVGGALPQELEAVLKVLEGHHLHPEELHPHEQGDHALSVVRGGLAVAEVAELGEEAALHGEEAGLGEYAEDLGVEVGHHVHVGRVRAEEGAAKFKKCVG